MWETINPGRKPWAMEMYRPKGLIYVFTTNQLRCCFDAVALRLFRNLQHICYNSLKLGLFF